MRTKSTRITYFPEAHELVPDEPANPHDRRKAPATPGQDTRPLRRLRTGREQELTDLGFGLLLEPGPGLTLSETAQRYPHIVNQLACLWNNAKALDAYLQSLLITDRRDRAGLDFKVAIELTNVRTLRVTRLRNVPRMR